MSSAAKPLVLGIETSCDETGIGIVAGDELLAHDVASSMEEHRRFGGVIPEIAARAHVEAFGPVLQRALNTAGASLQDCDAIAVTTGPGLSGALMVGLSAAKGLAVATGKPLYGVNHLVSHIAVGLLKLPGSEDTMSRCLPERCAALLVSGGHTEILQVNSLTTDVRTLGSTIDDAAGEAYDKVARLLKLGYPGGPLIDALAREGNPRAFDFPRGLTRPKFMGTAENPGKHRYDWSFSGLKTAVSRAVEQFENRDVPIPTADIAASFQAAVIDVLSVKTIRACIEHGLDSLLLGGGVAANRGLRELLAQRCADAGIELIVPPINLCTDNGAMVAALGAQLVMAEAPASRMDIAVEPSARAEQILF